MTPRGATELASLQRIADYYEKKLAECNAQTAGAVVRVLATEVDQKGIHGVEQPEEVEDVP